MIPTIRKHLDIINQLLVDRYIYVKRTDNGKLFAYANNETREDNEKPLDASLFPTVRTNDARGKYLEDLHIAYLMTQDIIEDTTTRNELPANDKKTLILRTLKDYYTNGMRYLVRQPSGYITTFKDLPVKNDDTGEWQSSTSVDFSLLVPNHNQLFEDLSVDDNTPTQIMSLLDNQLFGIK